MDPKHIRGASSSVLRDINRRIVLNLIRTRQPISRADLARLCGLQRSTISLIVEQLIEEAWVIEGATGRLPRGRRPTYLHLNEERVIIGVDVRPTVTTVGLSDANGKFSAKEVFDTPADPKTGIDQLIRTIRRILSTCKGKKLEGVGISIPARFDRATNRIAFIPNMNWRDVDIRTPIKRAIGVEVEVENVADNCALATVWFEKDETRNLVVIVVSEGLGTGILLHGQLVRGMKGMAGEFGHIPLEPNGPPCGCGYCGCWEALASNRAAMRYYREAGGQTEGMTFMNLLDRANEGDALALQSLEKMAHYLGLGMRMLVNSLAPERIVVVGDITNSWDRFGPIVEAEVKSHLLPGAQAPRVSAAHEDGWARIRGTVALILQKDFGVYY